MPRPYKYDPPIRPEEFQQTAMGQALLSGRLVATAVSPEDGLHITIRFSCKSPPEDRGRWLLVPFEEARKVYIDVPKADLGTGDTVGDYNRHTSTVWATNDDQRRVNAARHILLVAAGRVAARKIVGGTPESREELAQDWEHELALGKTPEQVAEVLMSVPCFDCGRPLTDPVSIRRGRGPVCFGKATGSQHERKGVDDYLPRATPQNVAEWEEATSREDPNYAEALRLHEKAEFARREREQEEAAHASKFVTIRPGQDPRELLR